MISSHDNPTIKLVLKLQRKKYRNQTGLFVVEGEHLIQEAKKQNIIKTILTISTDIKGQLISPKLMAYISELKTPSKALAICNKFPIKPLGNRVLFLDGVQDPGNVGTLIRTAASFGWTDIIVNGVDIYNSKTIRASQGAIFFINVVQNFSLSEIKKDYQIIGAMLDENATVYDQAKTTEKIVLVLGNEGSGISSMTQDLLDLKVYIPIKFESLNVAIAGGILLNKYKNDSK